MFDHDFKISCYVHEYSHIMDFKGARIVGHEDNFHERLLLEAWFSVKGLLTGNDHIAILEVYKSLARAYVLRYFFQNLTRNFSQRALDVLFLNHA